MALVIADTDTYKDGNNTTSTSITITLPAFSTGDLVIIAYNLWNNTGTPTTSWASGPDGETVTDLINGYGPSGSGGMQICIGYFIATANYAGGTMANTSSVATRWGAAIVVVPAGEYDPTTPISTAVSYASSASDVTDLDMPAFSAGASDGGGKLLAFVTSDQDPFNATMPSGYTALEIHDYGRAAILLAGRDAAVTNSESIAAATFDLNSTAADAMAVYAFIVREAPAYTLSIDEVLVSFSDPAVNTNDERDAKITGSVSVNSERSAKLTGKPTWSGEPSTESLQDDFNDNDLSTLKWTKEGDTGQSAEQNNRLEITHDNTAQYNGVVAAYTTCLYSSYGYVELADAGNQSITSHEAIFGMRKDSNNLVFFTASSGNLSAYKKVGGSQTQIGSSITYSSTTHKFLRIREDSGTVYFDTSSDGSSWTNRWTLAEPFDLSQLYVYMQSGAWQAESSGSYAYFDNLSLQTSLSFTWQGYDWTRRDYKGDSQYNGAWKVENVADPDGSDYLEITLTNPSGYSPIGAEFFSQDRGWGYGTYTVIVNKQLDTMHKALVFGGMFTFDPDTAVYFNEIDVNEVSAWGEHINVLLAHTWWYNDGGRVFDTDNTDIPSTAIQTHRLIWEPGKLTFDSFEGAGTGGTLILHTEVTTNVPTPANERIHFNLWAFGDGPISPDKIEEFTVQIRSFTFVELSASDERAARLTGIDTVADERDTKVTGVDTANSERSAKLTGKQTDSNERASKLTGIEGSNDNRAAKITGTATANTERSTKVVGGANETDERTAKLTGIVATNDTRAAKVTGTNTDNDERSAKITGQELANDERAAKLSGVETLNDERGAKVTGGGTTTDKRDSKIIGTATDASERNAKIIGGIADERDVKIYAGYADTVSDDFSTTDNKDSGNTTAVWTGNGEVTLG